jgi:hypothetical protein
MNDVLTVKMIKTCCDLLVLFSSLPQQKQKDYLFRHCDLSGIGKMLIGGQRTKDGLERTLATVSCDEAKWRIWFAACSYELHKPSPLSCILSGNS